MNYDFYGLYQMLKLLTVFAGVHCIEIVRTYLMWEIKDCSIMVSSITLWVKGQKCFSKCAKCQKVTSEIKCTSLNSVV